MIIEVPEPPRDIRAVVPLAHFSVVSIWHAWMGLLVATAWRERSITCDLSGNVLHYMRLTDQDRALLGIRAFNTTNHIEEIWIATNELTEEEHDREITED